MKRNKAISVWITEDIDRLLFIISRLKGTSMSSMVYRYIIEGLHNEDIEKLCVVEEELLHMLKEMILKLGEE